MYVCVCSAVTERQIHQAAAQGARKLRDLRHSLGVTAECGRCARCAHDCLQSALGTTSRTDIGGLVAGMRSAFTAPLEA
ncbi:(2Fe-2S)-binding protein [Thauera sp.]|uniref:(2Fe-2S)-binding protein n=1 Tax=Thauera sp. TaxID=1905334 RepID=UPI00261B1E05|nr:(2Fe-2S)-binding protein [Thauera sp.]MCK6410374.1 (2Fe-2S)-binding protein [Thauera sp.]